MSKKKKDEPVEQAAEVTTPEVLGERTDAVIHDEVQDIPKENIGVSIGNVKGIARIDFVTEPGSVYKKVSE